MILKIIDLQKEKWIQVSSFMDDVLDKYEVSDYGRVRINGERVMRNQMTGRYEVIGLNHKDGVRRQYYIHRLVALGFIPNDNPARTQVNHKKGKLKTWNHVDNLEWATPSENIIHSVLNQLQPVGTLHHMNKYSEDFIRQICIYLELGLKPRNIIRELDIMKDDTEYTKVKRLIKHIKMKNQWVHISREYNF